MMEPAMVAILGASVLALAVSARSLASARSRLRRLAERRSPFGWKYLEREGPPLGEPLDPETLRQLRLDGVGPCLLLYTFDCSKCAFLPASLPSLLEDFPELRVALLSPGPSKFRRVRDGRVHTVEDPSLASKLHFHVAPYAVSLESGTPARKGIVNSLEQLRLIVDPDQVFLDVPLQ